jgi:hypothetical protein
MCECEDLGTTVDKDGSKDHQCDTSNNQNGFKSLENMITFQF